MKLYFVRHGESEANLIREFSNTGIKHPLTAKGVQQAHELAARLSGLDVKFIYSSPVLRARQTAEILSQSLGVPVQITEALREWSVGIYEGTRDSEGWELHKQVMDDWQLYQKWDSKMPGGENFHEIRARFEPFIHQLVQEWRNSEENIILVAHGGLYLAMLPLIFQNVRFADVHGTGFANTAYALAEPRGEGLFCLEWCGKAAKPEQA